jgi:hypothetical protein
MEGTKNENEERRETKESRKIGASAVQVYSRSHCQGHTSLRSSASAWANELERLATLGIATFVIEVVWSLLSKPAQVE